MRYSRPDFYQEDLWTPARVQLRKGRECLSRSQLDAENLGCDYQKTVQLRFTLQGWGSNQENI